MKNKKHVTLTYGNSCFAAHYCYLKCKHVLCSDVVDDFRSKGAKLTIRKYSHAM
jgi:hypothetical protein